MKVVMAFRVDRNLREAIHHYAKEETRTVANWLESLVIREHQRRQGNVVTLESLDEKVDRLFDANNKSRRQKNSLSTEKKENKKNSELQKIFDLELPESLSSETWNEWVIYRKKKGASLTVELARELLERWMEHDDDGDDVDDAVKIAMQRGYNDAFYEKNRKKEEKPYWFGAK